jgi:mono/diheme cytochrome c family protein
MIETVSRRGFQWPTFTEEELANIISYVYYVKLFDEPGDAELGARWFREKRCVECHAVGGRGGRLGPALDRYARYIAPLALAQGMWNKGLKMRARQAARGMPMPTFLGREIADIQAYIRRNSNLRGREIIFLEPPDPNNGKKLFAAKRCVSCHGRDGGGTAFGPNLRTATQRLRVAEIAGELWNHSFKMTEAMRKRGISFPSFEGNEMADVIAFLYYLRFYESGGDLQAGAAVFAEKGCSGCHSGDGKPAVGPDLSRSAAVLSPLSLATAMWNHAPAMYARSKMENVEWPRFEGDEMRDLAVYLKSLARESPPSRAGEAGPQARSPVP